MQSPPTVSVIMPVYNGAGTLDRAVDSLVDQTFWNWELLIVDDGSTDASREIAQRRSEDDPRIRPLQTVANCGPAAARNLALQHARGEWITYLDCDDEYHPDYLEKVAALRNKADVLVSGYDAKENGQPAPAWNPASYRADLFEHNVSNPLGIAHRRELGLQAGGFNELLWNSEDWDFWRRLARTGAKFLYLDFKSGCYTIRESGQRANPNIPQWQRSRIEENWKSGRPIYVDDPHKIAQRKVRKIAFASAHALLGTSDQSAEAAARALQVLDRLGFDCRIFCASHLGSAGELCYEELLAQRQIPYEGYQARIGEHEGRLIFARQGNVAATIFRTQSTRGQWINDEEAVTFLTAYDVFLKKNRPDAVITHRRDPLCGGIIELAKRYDIPVIYWLWTADHMDLRLFRDIDYAVVPSEQLRDRYYDRIGLMCHLLPPVDEQCPDRVAPAYREFFENVFPQPFPPILPKPEHLAQR